MAQKITQAAISAAIAKRNANKKKCPYCVNGKVSKAKCGVCKGKG